MSPNRDEILAYFQELLLSMGEEWNYGETISDDTRILGDLNWRSVEIVYLVNELQKHYQRVFPFEQFLRTIEARETPDSSVGEWVDFIHEHLSGARAEPAAAT